MCAPPWLKPGQDILSTSAEVLDCIPISGEVTLRRVDEFEEPQLLRGVRTVALDARVAWAIHDQRVVGVKGINAPWGRGKTRGVKHPGANVGDFCSRQIVTALILREDHQEY